ncbi:MAG: MBL fold metallo-hydrolase [Bacteroidia bacterium]
MKWFLWVGLCLLGSIPAPAVEVVPIDLGISMVYLLRGERQVLVDTGSPDKAPKLEAKLRALGQDPADLDLIILTHGHGDHAGATSYFTTRWEIPVMAGRGDSAMMRRGSNAPLRPTSFAGRVLMPMVDIEYTGFAADVWIDDTTDLQPYGIAGRIVPARGHTPGSLAIVLDGGAALVGDLIRGSDLAAHAPRRHYFEEDLDLAHAQVRELIGTGATLLYPGHNGPLEAGRVLRFLERP